MSGVDHGVERCPAPRSGRSGTGVISQGSWSCPASCRSDVAAASRRRAPPPDVGDDFVRLRWMVRTVSLLGQGAVLDGQAAKPWTLLEFSCPRNSAAAIPCDQVVHI